MALCISDGEHNLEKLTQSVEEDVVPILEGIDGVSDVQVTGQQLEKVNIEFDEEKLNEYELDQDTVEQID